MKGNPIVYLLAMALAAASGSASASAFRKSFQVPGFYQSVLAADDGRRLAAAR